MKNKLIKQLFHRHAKCYSEDNRIAKSNCSLKISSITMSGGREKTTNKSLPAAGFIKVLNYASCDLPEFLNNQNSP